MSEQRDMSGALFREREKRSDKSPDYRGRITVAGITYKLSGWVWEKDGRKYLSLAVSEMQERRERTDSRPAAGAEEDIPF